MVGDHTVVLGTETVGRVQVRQEGLYYRFICRCRQQPDQVYRLMVSCGQWRGSIGVLTPEGDGFGLDKKRGRKDFPTGEAQFFLAPVHDPVQGKFVPISPREPFCYLQDLKDAFLDQREGQPGVVIHTQTGRE